MDHDDRLRPYVTGLAIAWARETPESRHRSIDGSLAFVDISGFTALTERLAAKGKIGAEEMSDVLDEKFAELLDVAYSYGALLVKWGGDAVLLLFEGPDHAALACRAAQEMQRTMRRIGRLQTSVGAVQLRMSVGINSGTFDFFLVGDRHLELLVAGPAATETAVMEGIAEAGEVLLSRETARRLPPRCLGADKQTGVLLRSGPPVAPRCRYWPRYEEPAGPSRFLDPAIGDHLRTEVGDCEHRQVAIGFVEISGVDELLQRQGPGAAAGALDDVIRVVQRACDHHRVTFWETDISKDGFKILLVAGAPRSSGHDEDAMLRAARTILDEFSGPVRLRVGVNTGRVFNGAFGPAFRRTWSVKGDAVNLAARVMARAETGQLLATETLLRRVTSRVDADLLPPFMVKGKKQLVNAAVVQRVSTDRAVDSASASTFVGRRAEMDVLLDAARAADRGNGRGVLLTGEPGVGKSRLADHVVNRIGQPVTVLRGFGEDYESATAYYAVRRLLRAAVGQAVDAPDAAVAAELRRLVRSRCPDLEPWLPLLAVPFDVDLPDTAETAAVAEEFRRPRTMGLGVQFLAAVLSGPTVLLVDDVHVADDLSAELIGRLVTHATERRWLVLLVGRAPPSALSTHESLLTIDVPPLPEVDARALVLDTPGGQLLAPHVIRSIVDRGEGNPLFLRELTIAVSAAEGDDLPSSLEDLLAAQIDDLAPSARKLLRSVSVLGSRFDEALASELLGEAPSTEQWQALDHFLARHADGSRRFRTRLARDAAYEGLAFRRRLELHGAAASALQKRATDDDDQAEALSLHCFAAQRYDDAWRHSLVAAERARRVYANVEALTFYERAQSSAHRSRGASATELAELLEVIGDLHARLAELELATAAYRRGRRLAPKGAALLRARMAVGAALVSTRGGLTTRTMRWFAVAEQDLAEAAKQGEPRRQVTEVHCRITVERATIRFRQGRHADVEALCQQALQEGKAIANDYVAARALQLLDMNDIAAGRQGDESRALRALQLFEKLGDLQRQAHIWNHLGIRAYYAGAWNLAVERYEQARQLLRRVGDDWNAAVGTNNIAEILVDQGRLPESEPLAVEALRVMRASGTPWYIGLTASLMGRVCARSGRFAEAAALLAEASAAYAADGERFDVIQTTLYQVECLVLQGMSDIALERLDEAERSLQSALHTAGRPTSAVGTTRGELPPDAPLTAQILRWRGYVHGQRGDRDAAARCLGRSLEAARGRGSLHDEALALTGLCWLSPDPPLLRQRELALSRLGIVWTPEVPRRARAEQQVSELPRQRAGSVAEVRAPAQ